MGKKINFYEDYGRSEIEKSSVLSKVYRAFKNVLYLLKNPIKNAQKVEDYNEIVEKSKDYQRDVIELGGRIGELCEQNKKVLDDFCSLAYDCKEFDEGWLSNGK